MHDVVILFGDGYGGFYAELQASKLVRALDFPWSDVVVNMTIRNELAERVSSNSISIACPVSLLFKFANVPSKI